MRAIALIAGLALMGCSATPQKSDFEVAVYTACNAVKKMDMFPGTDSKAAADQAIADIEDKVKSPAQREIADNMTFLLRGYQSAIETFKKDPSEKNLAALRKLEHDVGEIRDSVRPQ